MGRECTPGGSQQIMSVAGAAEVVAEVAEASPVGFSYLFRYNEEAAEGAMRDTSPQ